MKYTITILTAALMGLGGAFSRTVPAEVSQKPNIVLIYIDDMGYGDIGPFGSKWNRTPNLDRMASEGMKLTSFYCYPVCSASRAQVMTGCYSERLSMPPVLFPGSPFGISAKEHTVAELLKAQGYATMCVGKWHLGDQPEFMPTRHGFDHYFGVPYSNDMLAKSKVDGRRVIPLVRDEKVIELLDEAGEGQLTELYTDEAVKFITENKARPFFLYLPHTAVHTPLHPGDKFKGRSSNDTYGDWVEEVDWSVGRVLDTLRELKLAENTLVFFTSDNGGRIALRNVSNAPLRGFKGSTWEGGMREPTIAWWPGKIAPGSVNDAIAGNIDLLPTFVTLAGGTVPTDNKIDGKDLLPLLFGKTKESPREAQYYFYNFKLYAVRVGPWKLAVAPQKEGVTGNKNAVAVPASLDKPRLYNLDVDIGEKNDVAAENPEVVARLKPLITTMAAALSGPHGSEARQPGRVENPVTLYPIEETPKESATKKDTREATQRASSVPPGN